MALEGLDACLLELPLPHTRPPSLELFLACAEHIEAAGLRPILGHPERCDLVFGELGWVPRFRRRGWLAQVNASSLLGRHGREVSDAAWALVETGRADLVGSDGHRANRPPYLDECLAAVSARIGRDRPPGVPRHVLLAFDHQTDTHGQDLPRVPPFRRTAPGR